MQEGQRGGCEEIPLVQDKDQQLCFAGAAMKRYPMSKVLQEASEGRHTNHNHRKLVNLITRTTALSNSIKLSQAVWGHPGRVGHGGEL